jgi:putative CocE/NonD family hydrolase
VASTSALPHPVWLARRGYAVVVQDVRGRGDSQAGFAPFVQEASDGAATVEWAAALDFSNGDVAMYGFSYQGMGQLFTAAEKPPSLRAIAPMMCCPDPYEGWTYEGGCLRWSFVAFWAAQLAGQGIKTGPIPYDLNALPIAAALGNDPPPWFREWLEHPTSDDYWAALRPALEEISVPAFTVMGYFDDFSSGIAQIISALKAEAVCGPWAHMPWGTRAGEVELGSDAAPSLVSEALVGFFDRVLKGEEGGVRGPVTYYVGNRGWRNGLTWPPSHTSTGYTCTSAGDANSRHGDGRLLAGNGDPGPSDVLVSQPNFPFPGTPVPLEDQAAAEDRRDVLCYTTRTLDRDLTIVGSPTLSVASVSDAPTHDLIGSLVWVRPDGSARRLVTGARRHGTEGADGARHFEIQLRPIAWTIPAGHSLRLDISASRFPQFDRNPQTNQVLGWEARASDCRVATIEVFDARLKLPVEDGS